MFENNEKGDSLKRGTGTFFDQNRSQSPDNPNLKEENILRRIPLEITALSVLIALVAVPLFDPLTGLLVLAGGAFAALNFLWLKQMVSRVLPFKNGDNSEEKGTVPIFWQKWGQSQTNWGQSQTRQSQTKQSQTKAVRSTLAFYALRIVLILGIFFIIIFFFSKKILAFVVGFSTLVPVFLAEAAIALSKMKQWKS
jgi:hypothetical protein